MLEDWVDESTSPAFVEGYKSMGKRWLSLECPYAEGTQEFIDYYHGRESWVIDEEEEGWK